MKGEGKFQKTSKKRNNFLKLKKFFEHLDSLSSYF